MVWCGVAWCVVVWYGVVCCDVLCCGVVWCDVSQCRNGGGCLISTEPVIYVRCLQILSLTQPYNRACGSSFKCKQAAPQLSSGNIQYSRDFVLYTRTPAPYYNNNHALLTHSGGRAV